MSSENFRKFMCKVYDKLERIIANLNETHSKNIETLNEKHITTLEQLQNYRDSVNDIINCIANQDPRKYYQKIQEITEMDDNELNDEQIKWEFPEPKFKNIVDNPYKLDDIKVFKLWQPVEVEVCDHHQREVVVTFCKKAHCKFCLRGFIESNNFTCGCGKKLSPKNIHEIMGFSYKIENLQ